MNENICYYGGCAGVNELLGNKIRIPIFTSNI